MNDRREIIRHLQTEIEALESRLDSKNQLIEALNKQLEAHQNRTDDDRRTQIYRRAAIDIAPGAGAREFADAEPVSADSLGEALVALGSRLDHKFAEIKALNEITERVNAGMFFDEVLDHVFETFGTIIPYDRIGIALIEANESGKTIVRARWCRANYGTIRLGRDYAALLEISSLQEVANTKEPRILNDLEAYLREHPNSPSTKLMLEEGVLSSLTCPLVVNDAVTGFIFFSSLEPDTYRNQHVELFQQIAGELALTLEKSRAYEELYLRNEFIRKVFGQYVTNEVAEAVLKNEGPLALGGDRRVVTVLMADLRGFTAMSEALSPEEVVDALNVYLGTMSPIVMKYGGNIDNFIGDAVMAVFGVPLAKPDDAARAVACAVEMQNAMASVNEKIGGRNLPELSMGIGLSTGEVVAGNIGSEMRLKYSVIGNTVNLAARIEQLAGRGQVFASEATYLATTGIIRAKGHLNVQLEGIHQPVPIYEIAGIGGEHAIDKAD